ncbi:HpcH/HpaI aldolase/citrate lyase family protein [Cupriavidus sp. SK-4]|uniref:HpcH/HpaI aldolase family protein n=1 Tax=Cupriavidus sp. SK-4 TaxID=574750 RepID=UPI000B0130EC|nr:HpcH/HpaI aldolase/citrate lyase family protein [Cupriavidus sp. SK-4]
MLNNHFKQGLRDGVTQIGIWAALAQACTTEIMAAAGFDWLLIDAEHGPNDLRSVLAQLRAASPHDTAVVVRPPSDDPALLRQYLDAGVQTLLIPMVNSAAQARALVRTVSYPPRGTRGVASSLIRASRYGADVDYLSQAAESLCVIAQIESLAALDELEGILAVPGIDGVFFGPADLAASMGHIGRAGHNDVQQALHDGIVRVRSAGGRCGIFCADEAQAQRYLDWGCSFAAVGSDVGLLAQGAQSLRTRYTDAVLAHAPHRHAGGTAS